MPFLYYILFVTNRTSIYKASYKIWRTLRRFRFSGILWETARLYDRLHFSNQICWRGKTLTLTRNWLLLWSAKCNCLRIMCTRASSPNLSLTCVRKMQSNIFCLCLCFVLYMDTRPLGPTHCTVCHDYMNTTANISKQSTMWWYRSVTCVL